MEHINLQSVITIHQSKQSATFTITSSHTYLNFNNSYPRYKISQAYPFLPLRKNDLTISIISYQESAPNLGNGVEDSPESECKKAK